ncbi:MAG TPA: hypothetical protein VKA54_20665 [Gemmatimonadaceae bacterium]|nr:hypothetical protein [Gemmatimonadaceae bacterium]
MIPPRLRAGLVIGAVVIASGIAGAAIDRAIVVRRSRGDEGGRRQGGTTVRGEVPPQRQEDRRRTQMLDRLTRELSLTTAQRAGLDSIFQRTDSSLRAIRRETQPQIQQVFERSNQEVNARLDSTQRVKFAAMRKNRSREYHGGGRGGPPGERSAPSRQ